MTVALQTREAGDGPVLVLMHGLFGSSRNWVAIQKTLAEHFSVVSVDLRNHGASPWSDQMDYDVMAEDVGALIRQRGWDSVCLLGHSMGGKVAMTLALRQPELVNRLIVADIAPVVYAPHYSDYIDAMLGIDLLQITRRSDADSMLAASIPEPGVRAFLLQNLVHEQGTWSWRINLTVLQQSLVALGEFPVGAERPSTDCPTLFIRGSASDYVLDDYLPIIRAFFPHTELHTIAGAGHWLHAEQPAEFVTQVRRFLGESS